MDDPRIIQPNNGAGMPGQNAKIIKKVHEIQEQLKGLMEESVAHSEFRERAVQELQDANKRIKELELENDKLRK